MHRERSRESFTAVGNGQHIDKSLPESLRDWLEEFQSDNLRITKYNAEQMPQLRAKFPPDHQGLLSFRAAIDADKEADEIDKIDSVHACNEWDGVYFFLNGMSAEAKLSECQAAVSHLKFRIKEYDEPIAAGKAKYPDLDWTRNKMPAADWLDTWDQCLQHMGYPDRRRANDCLFGDFLRGRSSGLIIAIPGTNTYETWDDDDRSWLQDVTDADIVKVVRRDFRECFGVMHYNPYDNSFTIGNPPAPGNQDDFLRKCAAISARYAPKSRMPDLDSYEGLADKLLFADGHVYDFKASACRRVDPIDRLCRKCAVPYPEWSGPAKVKDLIFNIGEFVTRFYELGGKVLEPPAREKVADGLADALTPEQMKHADEIKWLWSELLKLEAPWTKWIREMWISLDDVLCCMRVVSRVLSGRSGFAQLYALTGPPSSGKSLLVMSLLRLLGEGPKFYVTPLGSGYFCNTPRADGETSKPVTNQ